jgi:hypothetical protein
MVREGGQDTIVIERRSGPARPLRTLLAPSYPLDARIEAITMNGRR